MNQLNLLTYLTIGLRGTERRTSSDGGLQQNGAINCQENNEGNTNKPIVLFSHHEGLGKLQTNLLGIVTKCQ